MNAGMPDTVIDSIYVPLAYSPGNSGFYCSLVQSTCFFPTQPVVNSGYMLAVENHSTKDYYITRTATGLGNGNGDAYTYYEGITDVGIICIRLVPPGTLI